MDWNLHFKNWGLVTFTIVIFAPLAKYSPIRERRFTVSLTLTENEFRIVVLISPVALLLNMPAPRMVTALVMFTASNTPDERLMTSPFTAAAWACCKADIPWNTLTLSLWVKVAKGSCAKPSVAMQSAVRRSSAFFMLLCVPVIKHRPVAVDVIIIDLLFSVRWDTLNFVGLSLRFFTTYHSEHENSRLPW